MLLMNWFHLLTNLLCDMMFCCLVLSTFVYLPKFLILWKSHKNESLGCVTHKKFWEGNYLMFCLKMILQIFHRKAHKNLLKVVGKTKFWEMGTRVKAGKMTSEVNGAERPFLTSKHISYFGGGTAQELF